MKPLFYFLAFTAAIIFLTAVSQAVELSVPQNVEQGGILKIDIKSRLAGKHYAFFGSRIFEAVEISPGEYLALVPVSVNVASGLEDVCAWEGFARANAVCKTIEIKSVNFPVSSGVVFVPQMKPEIRKKRNLELAEMEAVYSSKIEKRFWSKDLDFSAPLANLEETSPFGKIRPKRTLIGGKNYRWNDYHKGTDFRASVGTQVFAAESGIVRVAKHWLAEGNIVVLDHGFGLISMYFHLSKISVVAGSEVKKGDLIGFSGQTGFSQGPHLHFEIRIDRIPVNPREFLKTGGIK